MIQALKKNRKNSNHVAATTVQESEIETLQNALQEAMLREKQLIQEKAQREEEMKQQRSASKQYISVLMKEKKDLEDKIGTETLERMKALQAEAEDNKKDLKRVLQKLAQREHQHNEFEDEILSLKRALKEKERESVMYRDKYRMAADKLETTQQTIEKANHATQRFDETQTLLTSITAELKEAKQKNKIIENEKENLKDELTNQCAKITELNQTISHLNIQNTKYNETTHELSGKLEEITRKGKQQINELLATKEALTARNDELKDEMNELMRTHGIANDACIENEKRLQNEMSALRNENARIEKELATQIENSNITINELGIANKIREKKKNKLVRELQEQLKKEVIKSQEVKCKVLKLNDELIGKQTNNVNTALAKKLELQRNKIKYLTECIQQLHIDLSQKKTVITNITKRIDIGAIPTFKTPVPLPPRNAHREILQLQLLTQETTLQNAMLRKDLKLMGNALQESQNKIKTLQNLKHN